MDRINFEALPQTAEQLEGAFINNIVNGGGGVNRRTAFAFLSTPTENLYNNFKDEDTAEAALNVFECLSEYIDSVKSFSQILESAQARIMAVLSHNFPTDEAPV